MVGPAQGRKLLVASVGIAAVWIGCGDSSGRVAGNLMDTGTGSFDVGSDSRAGSDTSAEADTERDAGADADADADADVTEEESGVGD